jgi:hypothetical protein
MRFLGDGATGPNGRESRSAGPTDPGADRSESDETPGGGGAHGSLMQRYRGVGAPPAQPAQPAQPARPASGKGGEVTAPLPPPRPAGDSRTEQTPTTPPDSWRLGGATGSGSGWSPAGTASPPATPAAGTASPAGTSAGTSTSVGTSAATAAGTPTPTAAPAPPAATTTLAPAGPAAPKAGPTPTLSAEQGADFRRRWRELQGDFVDDPQQAVRSAGELTREVLEALTEKIADKRRVDGWKAGEGSGTEDLRLSLRRYRTLVDRLLEL